MHHHHHPRFLHLQQHLLLRSVLLMLSAASWTTGASADDGEFIFDGFSGNNHLAMDGEAQVTDGGLLRLTTGQTRSEDGHAFYTNPLDFTSDIVPNASSVPSFSTTFVFAMLSHSQSSGFSGRHGRLSFVLSPTKEHTSNHLLLKVALVAVRNLSIYANSLQAHPAGYYSPDAKFHQLSLNGTKPMQVWVDYDTKHTILNVTIAPCCSMPTKPSRPLLSVTCKLPSILQTTPVYAGFSSISDTSDHYIIGWSFKLNGEAAALNYSALPLKTIQDLAAQTGARPSRTIAQTGARPSTRISRTILCAALVSTLGVTIVVSATLFKIHRKRRLEARRNEIEWEREYGCPSFTYKDLCAATGGFKDKMLLGKGGFGSVFKGLLPHSKQTVAIKRTSPESKQGMKEFMAEIIILGRLRHRNLVQLLGYCRHKQQLLLVYDYMPNGSLDFHLHTQDQNTTNLCWAQRFHILKCIASGIFYLHEECQQVVIHRDIKTSNVLLDNEMNARLGDFGLARSHDHGADAHTTRMAGTWGYIAPELARLGKATKATDVFAFGVLMMEVACGRRPIWVNTDNGEPLALADWVLEAWRSGSITDAVDPRLDDYVEEEIELVLKVGLLCSHPSPNARPSMRLIMQYLQRDIHLPSDLEPNSLLNIGLVHDEMHDQQAMSCPLTVITDLSKGR